MTVVGIKLVSRQPLYLERKIKLEILFYCYQASNHNPEKTKLESQVSSASQQSLRFYFSDNRKSVTVVVESFATEYNKFISLWLLFN